MREILFRGKAINRDYGCHRTNYKNGDWVYGLVTRLYDERFENLPAEMTNVNGIEGIEVDYKTIGQYTGLTDKNGRKIFEGDIVSTKYKLGRGGYYVFEVYYNENLCQFALTINSRSYTKNKQYDWLQLTSLKANKVEVIGNIHDNPELLKEGNESVSKG